MQKLPAPQNKPQCAMCLFCSLSGGHDVPAGGLTGRYFCWSSMPSCSVCCRARAMKVKKLLRPKTLWMGWGSKLTVTEFGQSDIYIYKYEHVYHHDSWSYILCQEISENLSRLSLDEPTTFEEVVPWHGMIMHAACHVLHGMSWWWRILHVMPLTFT